MQVKKQSNRRKVFQPFRVEDIKNLPQPLRAQAEYLQSLSEEDIARAPLITSAREYREYMEKKNRTMNSTSQSN